nr:transposase [Pseudoroseomonas vastitatis]
MKKRYTAEQIIGLLRQAEVELAQGRSVGEVCRGLGVSESPSGIIWFPGIAFGA